MPETPKEIQVIDGGCYLTEKGHEIVKRGGHDAIDEDEMLLYEVLHRAPGMPVEELQNAFIAIKMEYGNDALKAIRSGHVQFEKARPEQ